MRSSLVFLSLLSGCGERDVAQQWQIDRMRILAVQTSVLDENGALTPRAEPQPGETVRMASLTVHPDIESPHILWTGCLQDDSDLFGCIPDDEEGFLGIEPFMPPSMVVPESVLEGLTENEKAEGRSYQFTLIAVPDIEELDESLSPDSFTNDEEIATKHMPVYLSETPNNNPFIEQILIERVPITTGATVTVVPGQTYFFEPVLAFGPEEYIFINSSGEQIERVEEPYFSWYTTEGSFDFPFSDTENNLGVNWTAPLEPERSEAKIWIVVRDQRGGMGWAEQVLRFE